MGAGIGGQAWRQVIAAYAGWLMDGYTTIAYALVALTISKLFFPSQIGLLGLIATFGGLAAEALARPFGSLVMGNYLGDRIGRKGMLTLTIIGFSAFAGAKGLLPTYAQAGILAPVLLYVILFLEGMFAGAEYGGGTTLSMESVGPEARVALGAFVQSGFGTGYFIVSFVYAWIYSALGPAAFASYGWRLLFLTTFVPGVLTLAIRLLARETPVFEEMRRRGDIARVPAAELFRKGGRPLALALLMTSGLLFVNTATFTFYPTLLGELYRMSGSAIGYYVGIINLVSLLGVWSGGLIGLLVRSRKALLVSYSAAFLALVWPVAAAAFSGGPLAALAAFSAQAFVEAMIFAALPAFLSEAFGRRFRATGVGFAYNGGAIFGGFAISIVLATSAALGLMRSWVLWLLAAGAMVVAGAALSEETYGRD